MRHRRNDDVGTPVPTLELVPPDARAEIDHLLRSLSARHVVSRAEAVAIVETVAWALGGDVRCDELVRPLFAALDAVADDALVDRSVVVDALLDVRLAQDRAFARPAGELADEMLSELAGIGGQPPDRG